MLKRLAHIALGLLLVTLVACEGINCPLNNVVLLHIAFYDSSTKKQVALTDTLTVTAEGTDSVLINRKVGASEISLPMSYWREADSLFLSIAGEDYGQEEAVRIQKTNLTHTESPDCPATMFHTLTGVEWDHEGTIIDSIKIVRPLVNFDTDENIRIYLHTDD